MKSYKLFILSLFTVLFGAVCFAQTTDPTADFISQVLQALKNMGGLAGAAKVASICLLIIASMKVSVLNQWVWSKLGAAQVWVAPILGLLAGILSLPQITLAGVLAYAGAGAGAILLHELLDSVKAVPGLGAMWTTIINIIESVLGGPAAQASALEAKK